MIKNLFLFALFISEKTAVTLHFRLNVISQFALLDETLTWPDIMLITERNIMLLSRARKLPSSACKIYEGLMLQDKQKFWILPVLIIKFTII